MPSLMTQRKLQRLAALRQSYLDLRSRGGGGPGWDAWFSQPLNNAHLAPIGAYYDMVHHFRRLFNALDKDFEVFYKAVGRIADGPKQGPRTTLAATP
jgi:predicted aminopeptidase